MNRTDRLLAIVLELQAKKQVRAEDLAALFEVSKRTIYRDILALDESGVPIVAVPGQGYSLVEGYFLPPLLFSSNEAIMLLLGADAAGQNFDMQYRSAAQSASNKIKAVLPEHLRQEVEYLESSIRFVSHTSQVAPEMLYLLRQAVIERRTVRFRYHTRHRSENSAPLDLRDADPYALLHIGPAWMMIAYCHMRRETRNFRLDRMEQITMLDQVFTRPSDFKIERESEDERTVTIRALFDHETARWVREAPPYHLVSSEDLPEGLLLTLRVTNPGTVLNWLLSWGSHVRVLEPDELREMMAHEAELMYKNHLLQYSSKP